MLILSHIKFLSLLAWSLGMCFKNLEILAAPEEKHALHVGNLVILLGSVLLPTPVPTPLWTKGSPDPMHQGSVPAAGEAVIGLGNVVQGPMPIGKPSLGSRETGKGPHNGAPFLR